MSAGDKYFQGNPIRLDVSRSRFPLDHNWRGTFDAGRWVPFYTQEVLAGDTFKVDANVLVRSATPAVPVMDDATISVEFFYVPFDLILSRAYMVPGTSDSTRSWRYFFGAQDSTLNMPTPASGVTLPTIDIYGADYKVGGLADCLGIPCPQALYNSDSEQYEDVSGNYYKVNALKALAYYAVYNEYLRDPNTMSPVTFSIVSGRVVFSSIEDAGIPVDSLGVKFSQYGLAVACANHGYFGSALPWPQRNSVSVTLPLGTSAPVLDSLKHKGTLSDPYYFHLGSNDAITTAGGTRDLLYNPLTSYAGQLLADLGSGNTAGVQRITFGSGNTSTVGAGLSVDLENATAASINTIRAAFATQRWFEQLARSGNRYDEMIQGMFGVTPPSKGNKPEYLGGKDIPISINQVNATTGDDLGETGANSNTFDAGHYFTKSFTEPGLIIGLMCVRTHDSFAQGVDPFDVKSERFDFYWPQFANLGEVGLTKKLLFVHGNSSGEFTTDDQSIFGYQEYAAEYRYHPDVVTGHFRPRPGVTADLVNWTYVNFFDSAPTLKSFLIGGDRFKSNVARTLKYQDPALDYQYFSMVHINAVAVRPMPLHSIPGLLDHH